MKKIAVVTDSHSSITPAEAAMLGVYVLPICVVSTVHPTALLCGSSSQLLL